MELSRLAAILIITGFVVFWIGNLSSPPRVYSESDPGTRLEIVADHPTRWAVSQGLGGVGIGIVFLGLLLLSLDAYQEVSLWLTLLPAGINVIAVVLISIWLYQYINAPAVIWEGAGYSSLLLIASALAMISAVLYGLLFLQTGLPAWIGYVSIGYGVIALIAILVARPTAFAIISIYLLVLLVAAIMLLRR